ncbi:MAG TPA: zinc-binding dehydrogenase [Acidimicrobiales bacterium]|nr:zinc-binding dehydrogenase [Acidimicrobiales bacterium]
MQAVTIAGAGLEWASRPDPEPADTELLVEVKAAGLNAADLLQRAGLYPAPAGVVPDIPGIELAGVVVGTGRRVTGFRTGDRVMAVVPGGAQAELAVVDAACAMPVPAAVAWDEAGGFAEAFSTAHDALMTQCGVSTGDRVLVTGAAGGVGSAGVQLAAAAGASVVASVRDPALRDAVRALGAAEAYEPEEALAHGPFDVALELVGGASFPGVLKALATGGRIAVIGIGSGARAEIDLLALMQRRARVHGSTLRARTPAEKALVAGAVAAHVVPLLAQRRVRVSIAVSFPMARAEEAYARFAEGGKLGKIVLTR